MGTWTWMLYLGLLLLVAKVSCSGIFELHLKSLRNDGALNSDGNCCSGVRRTGSCTSVCRTFFRVCLHHYQISISENPSCTFGAITTEVLGENSFTLPTDFNTFTNPIKLPFDFSWPGTFTLIIEAWHDTTLQGPSLGSPRELVLREQVSRSVQVGEEWSHFSFSPPAVPSMRLDYKYRVVCDEDYYGPGCSAVCRPRDDRLGHYSCSSNGTKICLDGWTGAYCDQVLCLPGCHPVNGGCDAPNECECRLGWQGRFCNECIAYPGCQHGSCNKEWECNCEEGWGGLFCNQDLNYCTHHQPCANGSTCMNTGEGSYTCECPPNYKGTNCETRIDNCRHQPCLNGGTCENTEDGGYRCKCVPPFSGRYCATSARTCDESPCQNGGTCSPYIDSYRCLCRPGYTGVNCDIDINECASNPCQNGKCIDELNGYRCICNTGYGGQNCTPNVYKFCSEHPCQNGGTCIEKNNNFECQCLVGFIGSLCETNVPDCANKPCANGGTCHDLVNDFKCVCAVGFSGKDCRQNIDDCASQPCDNGGTCTDLIGDYRCQCRPGYSGKNCDIPPGVVPHPPPTTASTDWPTSGDPPAAGLPTSTLRDYLNGQDKSVVTMQQLLLIICLGVGIPIVIIIIIIVFLLCNRRRSRDDTPSVQKENEQNEITNMNNTPKYIDATIINTIPTGNMCLKNVKMTNEEQDSSRTFNKAKQQLNLDSVCIDKSSNKTFIKNCNTNAHTVHQTKASLPERDLQLKCNRNKDSTKNNSLERDSSSVESTSVDISALHTAADVHSTQTSYREPNSILYLEKPHRQQPYSEGMLATEV